MKTIVVIPTFNERENIEKLTYDILNLKIPGLEILVVDDFSPDGTWKIVKSIAKKEKKVHLLLRTKDKGRGSAGRGGFKSALTQGADFIIEMDADFSHQPRDIPRLLESIKKADLVLGSRFVSGGKEVGRGTIRRIITKFANLYIRVILGLNVRDCNSGFRCFRRKVLIDIKVDRIESKGPAIVQEVLFKTHLKGFKIKEVPITFVDREEGESKLGMKQLVQGYFMVIKLKFLSLIGRL